MALFEVIDLSVSYGKAAILQGITLTLEDGELAAVIGPNGAGKTTMMRAIAGLTPGKGNIIFDGQKIDHLPAHEIVRKRIVLCPERRRLFSEMTVIRNLEMGAYMRKDRKEIKADLEKILILFPQLEKRKRNISFTLSGGEQQMLAVARSLMSNPKLLMLDEPSFGLAPKIKGLIAETVREIRKNGLTIMIAEQDVQMAFDTAERIYVLENGKIVIQGDKESLMTNEHVKQVYLGHD